MKKLVLVAGVLTFVTLACDNNVTIKVNRYSLNFYDDASITIDRDNEMVIGVNLIDDIPLMNEFVEYQEQQYLKYGVDR